MQKSHSFDVLSSRQCSHKDCSTLLKQRLVEDKPTATLCYKHYKEQEALSGHTIDTTPRRKRLDAGLPVKAY